MTTENKKGKTVQNFRTNIPDDTTKHETQIYFKHCGTFCKVAYELKFVFF